MITVIGTRADGGLAPLEVVRGSRRHGNVAEIGKGASYLTIGSHRSRQHGAESRCRLPVIAHTRARAAGGAWGRRHVRCPLPLQQMSVRFWTPPPVWNERPQLAMGLVAQVFHPEWRWQRPVTASRDTSDDRRGWPPHPRGAAKMGWCAGPPRAHGMVSGSRTNGGSSSYNKLVR